jgi:hypothetical protein
MLMQLDVDYARRHADAEAGEYVAISVSDTGIGMPADVAARAFDPFFTTKPIGLGTGLGLSMIYGFAKQSWGHLHLYSEEGRGTTLRLYLARAYTDLNLPSTIEAVETPRGEGETILIVEDDATVRLLVTAVLEELGYGYLEAPGAPQAMTILRSGARIDLLLTDVGLPIMNGRQLAEFARESRTAWRKCCAERSANGWNCRPPWQRTYGRLSQTSTSLKMRSSTCHQCPRRNA